MFKEAFDETIFRLSDSKKEIFVIQPSPEFRFKGNYLIYKNQLFPNTFEGKISLKEYFSRNKEVLEIFLSTKGSNVNFVDLRKIFCSDTDCYILNESGLPYFSDTNHVNELGAKAIVNELFPIKKY